MNAEWMPDENEIDGFVDGCEQYDRNYVLDRWGKLAQRKLLEYLTQNVLPFYEAYNTIPNRYTSLKIELKSMLKQLEGKNV